MDPREPIENAPDPAQKSRFFRWLDNYWYHYKWHTIIAAFILVTIVVCFAQCSSRESYDMTVTFAGGKILNRTEQEGFGAALEAVMPADYDGNGTKMVQLVTYGIYTEEELKALYSAVDAEGKRIVDDMAYASARKQNQDDISAFSTFVKTGECAVWFVSPYAYEQFNLAALAVPLAETFGSDLPEGAADDYAVRLKDTAFYRTYEAVRQLPEDTLIILTQPLVYGKTAKKANYADYREMYLAILRFQPTP